METLEFSSTFSRDINARTQEELALGTIRFARILPLLSIIGDLSDLKIYSLVSFRTKLRPIVPARPRVHPQGALAHWITMGTPVF